MIPAYYNYRGHVETLMHAVLEPVPAGAVRALCGKRIRRFAAGCKFGEVGRSCPGCCERIAVPLTGRTVTSG